MSPVLETERLRLRGWRDDDLDALAAHLADPEIARFTAADGRPQGRDSCFRILSMMAGAWALKGYGMFAVEERTRGVWIGRVGVFWNEGWGRPELGWGLDRTAWGRGYAVEASRAAAAWAVARLDLAALDGTIHVDNVRSQATAERLGQRPIRPTYIGGAPHVIWSAPRENWL